MDDVRGFYDGFADTYELAYGGRWDEAVERQGAALDALIRATVPDARDVLDCACGIGTQALGLARRGYRVTGTDISEREVERARREAERLGVDARFAVADFRDLAVAGGPFDAVLCCDNALPHLLDPEDVVQALREMHARLRPGGLLVVTLRDFDRALAERPPLAPAALDPGPPRRVLVRLHDWDADAPVYTVRYLVLTEGLAGWDVVEHATRYRALTRAELEGAARAAGFERVDWPEEPVVVGGQLVLTARR
jgi:SAM-dependent methyltransferase